MSIRSILPAIALIAAIGSAAIGQTSPGEAARAFTLDSMAPPPAGIPSPGALSAPPPPTVRAIFTLDTPIQALIADPGAKAVLDKDLPGMSDDENIDKFKLLSLHALQPQTGGQLTDALLAKVAADLDALAGSAEAAPIAPARIGNAKRNADGSR